MSHLGVNGLELPVNGGDVNQLMFPLCTTSAVGYEQPRPPNRLEIWVAIKVGHRRWTGTEGQCISTTTTCADADRHRISQAETLVASLVGAENQGRYGV